MSSPIPALNEQLTQLVREMRKLDKKSPIGHCMDAHVMYQFARNDPSFATLMHPSTPSREFVERKKRGPYKKNKPTNSIHK